MADSIFIRDVIQTDVPIFFEQERDPDATLMAAFPCRGAEAFASHWKQKILGDKANIVKTIVFNDRVAGSVECWEVSGKWLVGYWLGKEYWGKGIATAALGQFLTQVKIRPLKAHVANHNKGSIRVLQKCGFKVLNLGTFFRRFMATTWKRRFLSTNSALQGVAR